MKWRYKWLRHAGLVKQSQPLYMVDCECGCGWKYGHYGWRHGGELTAQETYVVWPRRGHARAPRE